MLHNFTNYRSSRYVRRIFIFIFIWSLIMIAALQFKSIKHQMLSNNVGDNRLEDVNSDGGDGGTSFVMTDVYHLPQMLKTKNNHGYGSYFKKSSNFINDNGNNNNLQTVENYFGNNSSSSSSSSSTTATTISTSTVSPTVESNKKLLLDETPVKSEDELIKEIERELPSLPLSYWLKNKNVNAINNKGKDSKDKDKTNKAGLLNCSARYPNIYELEFNNIYWQTLRSKNGTFQLFGAYYDNRKLSRIGPAIRIVGMIDRIEPKVKTYCQLWYNGKKNAEIVDILEYKYIWHPKWGNYKQGIYQPYVIACKIPQLLWSKGVPASVSLVESPCNTASNNLRVIYNKPEKKKKFAVCVKGLDFLHEDLSVRLIEWIELIKLLGSDKIYFYQLQVHPNVTKVLNYYSKLNYIDVTPLTLPGGQPNIRGFQHMYLTKNVNNKRQNELIPYNDCLYKHMYEYEYIALLDIDEVIMPIRDSTWNELMIRVSNKALKIRNETHASYNVRNVYFLDDLLHSHGYFHHIPKYMHMLQHVYRSMNFTKPNQYVKCFHNPERVVTLHNHFPLACLGADCTSYPIDTQDAQLQHYRADCVKSLKKSCTQYRDKSIMDTTIWKHKDLLIDRVTNTLEKLGFFNNS